MPTKLKNPLPPLFQDADSVGSRIARMRKERGLTQTQLARFIGISQSLLCHYESGRLALRDHMVARLAEALGVSNDDILGAVVPPEKAHHPVSLKVSRRMVRIERLPPKQQRELLTILDVLIRGAEYNATVGKPTSRSTATDPSQPSSRNSSTARRRSKSTPRKPARRTWSTEEREVLRIFYPKSPQSIILDTLRKRSWEECRREAQRLGVLREISDQPTRTRRKKKPKYSISKKKLQELLKNPELTVYEIAQRMGTTAEVVRRNIFRYGL